MLVWFLTNETFLMSTQETHRILEHVHLPGLSLLIFFPAIFVSTGGIPGHGRAHGKGPVRLHHDQSAVGHDPDQGCADHDSP